MRRIRQWLIERFLPAWCRAELVAENQRQKERIDALERENERLNAFVDGVEFVLRRLSRAKVSVYPPELGAPERPHEQAQHEEKKAERT